MRGEYGRIMGLEANGLFSWRDPKVGGACVPNESVIFSWQDPTFYAISGKLL